MPSVSCRVPVGSACSPSERVRVARAGGVRSSARCADAQDRHCGGTVSWRCAHRDRPRVPGSRSAASLRHTGCDQHGRSGVRRGATTAVASSLRRVTTSSGLAAACTPRARLRTICSARITSPGGEALSLHSSATTQEGLPLGTNPRTFRLSVGKPAHASCRERPVGASRAALLHQVVHAFGSCSW